MSKNYLIIGAGRQGLAAAFDLINFGDAEKIGFIDNNYDSLNFAAEKLRELTRFERINSHLTEVSDYAKIKTIMEEYDAAISAVPYYFNVELTKCAISAGCNFVDLGGNTDIVWKQLELNKDAANAGVSVIPDCGMDPGLNISIIEYLINQFDEVEEIKNYGGGIPLNPKPPWNYELYFHINGLTNEYYGNSIFLREGKITEVPCFSELEVIDFGDRFGKLEANVTNGGLSVLPWKLEGKVDRLENRTLRYPGHWEWFKAYSQLGLFEEEEIEFKGMKISPREFYHFLLEPKLKSENPVDIGIVLVTAVGKKDGLRQKISVSVIEEYDQIHDFTAMQKLTGWHASVMAILAANSAVKAGVLSVDDAAKGKIVMTELSKRGFEFKEDVVEL